MTKNNLKVVKSAKDKDLENKEKNKVTFGTLVNRKGQHSKKMSKHKKSKNYVKPYRGQGR